MDNLSGTTWSPIDVASPKYEWTPDSWRSRPTKQEVVYANSHAVQGSTTKLKSLPPIVTPHEIWQLRAKLRDVAHGKAFLLQGGDCAELFDYCNAEAIDSKVKLLLQMSLVLVYGAKLPVVRIARMAGQYAKPRSSPNETASDGRIIPSFRGDILNGYAEDQRDIDPTRLVQAYFHSAATLNYVRAQLSSGFADLHRPLDWNLGHVGDPETQAQYAKIIDSIRESLQFMQTIGVDTSTPLQTVDLYTSHEGLLLEYEAALTRLLKHPHNMYEPASKNGTSGYYNTSAHFLWVGDRTRQPTHAHVEYFRGIQNPIGIKVGPTTSAADLLQLLEIVNPNHEAGKVTIITRYGASRVADLLPAHIEAVTNTKHRVVWQCDPMHGNTRSTSTGVKTRSFAAIYKELSECLAIHRRMGSYMGGVHLELTGNAVTECTGGSEGLQDEDLGQRYETFCDPRLNEKQALELAFLIARSQREPLPALSPEMEI